MWDRGRCGMCWDDLVTAPPQKKAVQTTWSLLNFGRPSRDLLYPGYESSVSPITTSFSHSNNLSINGIGIGICIRALLSLLQVSAVASAPFRRCWPVAPASAVPPRSYAPGSACARGVVAKQPFVGSWSQPRRIKDHHAPNSICFLGQSFTCFFRVWSTISVPDSSERERAFSPQRLWGLFTNLLAIMIISRFLRIPHAPPKKSSLVHPPHMKHGILRGLALGRSEKGGWFQGAWNFMDLSFNFGSPKYIGGGFRNLEDYLQNYFPLHHYTKDGHLHGLPKSSMTKFVPCVAPQHSLN